MEWMKLIKEASMNLTRDQSTLRKSKSFPFSHELGDVLRDQVPGLVPFATMYQAPVWVPDSYADGCMLCQVGFNFIKRRVRKEGYIHSVASLSCMW
jgi:hypothetical protein